MTCGYICNASGVSPSIYAIFQCYLLIKGNSSLYLSAGGLVEPELDKKRLEELGAGAEQDPRHAREPLVPGAEINSKGLTQAKKEASTDW